MNAGPMNPIGIEKYWKLPRNQSGAWCHSRPWRSSSGTQSIERRSTSQGAGACPPPAVPGAFVVTVVVAIRRLLSSLAVAVHDRTQPLHIDQAAEAGGNVAI